jgi:hypothetical protein
MSAENETQAFTSLGTSEYSTQRDYRISRLKSFVVSLTPARTGVLKVWPSNMFCMARVNRVKRGEMTHNLTKQKQYVLEQVTNHGITYNNVFYHYKLHQK